MAEKRCGRCGESWPADAEFFRPRSAASPRLLCWCRACEAEQKAQSRRATPLPTVITDPSAGTPSALSALAAMLLRLHAKPPVRLVEPHDEEQSRAVPAIEQRP